MSDASPSVLQRLLAFFRGKEQARIQPWDAARQHEAAVGLALLAERRRNERFERRMKFFLSMWPLGIGIGLAIISPILLDTVQDWGPWGATLVFPFVVLANRPELQAGPITHLLPSIMLYAQFPIEGLLARLILRRPVLPFSVTIQVMLFHFLGIIEVWMLSGSGPPPPVIR
jgi:hypothetical protein